MKVFFNKHVFEYNWETVTQALWLKYPNPFSTHVLSSDIIERTIDKTLGKLHTKRLLLKTSSVPAWGRALINVPQAYILEESIVDYPQSTMTITTKNISYTGLMYIEEHQLFSRHPENNSWTLVNTEAKFQSHLSWGFKTAVESFCYSKFRDNLIRSRQAIQYILDKLKEKKGSILQSAIEDDKSILADLLVNVLFFSNDLGLIYKNLGRKYLTELLESCLYSSLIVKSSF